MAPRGRPPKRRLRAARALLKGSAAGPRKRAHMVGLRWAIAVAGAARERALHALWPSRRGDRIHRIASYAERRAPDARAIVDDAQAQAFIDEYAKAGVG